MRTLCSVPSVSVLEKFDSKYGNTKKDTQLFSLITLIKCWLVPFEAMRANNFSRGRLPQYIIAQNVLDFLDQQEKFATSAACVTKLTLAAKVAFIRKILFFEREVKNVRLWFIFLALPVKNGPLPAELKFKDNTVQA